MNINVKKGPSSVQTTIGDIGLADKRVETERVPKFPSSFLNHSYRNIQCSSIDLKEIFLRSLIENLSLVLYPTKLFVV